MKLHKEPINYFIFILLILISFATPTYDTYDGSGILKEFYILEEGRNKNYYMLMESKEIYKLSALPSNNMIKDSVYFFSKRNIYGYSLIRQISGERDGGIYIKCKRQNTLERKEIITNED